MPLLDDLRSLILRHAGDDETSPRLPGLVLRAMHLPTEPVRSLYEPAFAMIAQGAKRTVLGDKAFDYGVGQYLVASVDLPVSSHVVRATREEPYLAFALTLKPAAIATLLLEAAITDGGDGKASGLAVSTATVDLLDPMVRFLRLLERPEDMPVLAPMIEREILWRLLNGEQGAMMRQIGLADSRLSQIGRAIRWIRAHYVEIIRTEDLADVAGMSPSSFHRHFRAVTAMSPLQFQKQIRLQEARARLMAKARDVAAVGFEVGYDSPSQFSREYSRLFGAPPGRDAGRLQATRPLSEIA
jgi:AraC-like DNA-binding protein